MEVFEAIRTKRAVRVFNDKSIEDELIIQIANAGRRAQSAKNLQPWNFIVVRSKSTLHELSLLGNWADHLSGASFGIAIITPHPEERFSIMFDAGQAAAYMQLAAWDIGVGSCIATIYETEKARELLGFPRDLHARVAISFGYPSDHKSIKNAPKIGGRRTIEEVIHWEKWQWFYFKILIKPHPRSPYKNFIQ